jgi:hypothetical protein
MACSLQRQTMNADQGNIIYSESHMKHKTAVCGQKTEFCNIKASGTRLL